VADINTGYEVLTNTQLISVNGIVVSTLPGSHAGRMGVDLKCAQVNNLRHVMEIVEDVSARERWVRFTLDRDKVIIIDAEAARVVSKRILDVSRRAASALVRPAPDGRAVAQNNNIAHPKSWDLRNEAERAASDPPHPFGGASAAVDVADDE
jgi:hypothetical protein